VNARPTLAESLAQAAREINAPQDPQELLERIVRLARDSMPEIDHVGISVAHRGGTVTTEAATDDVVRALDDLQYQLGEGPCLHAIDDELVVLVENASREERWPRFIKAAVDLGLRSQLGLRVYVDQHERGALNLYSFSSDTIEPETRHLAEQFAAQASVALGRARLDENLTAALASRTSIGVAIGLLMERHTISQSAAFAYLSRVSSTREIKLRHVARRLVEESERKASIRST